MLHCNKGAGVRAEILIYQKLIAVLFPKSLTGNPPFPEAGTAGVLTPSLGRVYLSLCLAKGRGGYLEALCVRVRSTAFRSRKLMRSAQCGRRSCKGKELGYG